MASVRRTSTFLPLLRPRPQSSVGTYPPPRQNIIAHLPAQIHGSQNKSYPFIGTFSPTSNIHFYRHWEKQDRRINQGLFHSSLAPLILHLSRALFNQRSFAPDHLIVVRITIHLNQCFTSQPKHLCRAGAQGQKNKHGR